MVSLANSEWLRSARSIAVLAGLTSACAPADALHHDSPIEDIAAQTPLEPAPAYFRGGDELRAAAQALAAARPDLVGWHSLGPAWEATQGLADREVWALRISGPDRRQKPAVLWTGGLHAREIGPPEVLLGWAEELVGAYGQDPDVTARLDRAEVWLVPLANPDGHAVVEAGFADGTEWRWQRKNTSVNDLAAPAASGVDINRNFDEAWAQASDDPHWDTYGGPSAVSEPETRAVRDLVDAVRPRLLIDLHAFGDAVLMPSCSGQLDDTLVALAERLAGPLAVDPCTAWTSGEGGFLVDWAVSRGIPALAIELGPQFHPTVDELADMRGDLATALGGSLQVAAEASAPP